MKVKYLSNPHLAGRNCLIFFFFVLVTPCFSLSPASLLARCLEGDCVNGWGKMNISQGYKYTGQWKNGRPHGKGTATTPAGNEITGDNWREGRLQGHGVETYKNGRKYVGQFKNSRYNGIGIDIYPDGVKYTGQFKDGHPSGRGKLIFPNGTILDGKFKDGHANGKGKLLFYDGSVYKGEFENGRPHGYGTEYCSNGLRNYEGLWDMGAKAEINTKTDCMK